jgi:hypothetical protein
MLKIDLVYKLVRLPRIALVAADVVIGVDKCPTNGSFL